MAKLTRVPAKVFAASAAANEIGQFGSAVAGAKLETADVAIIQGLSAWLDGWSEALVSGNRYPALQEMNGLLKVLSYQGAYALQEGIAEYDASTTYYTGSIVKKTGTFELYGSLTDDNVGNALTVDTEWQFLCDLSSLTSTTLIPQTICSTAAATAAKTATLSDITIVDDVHFYINFTNANTSSTITLNVNSEGDWDIYDLKGNQITGDYFSNAAGESVLLKADKTNSRFILITAPFWMSRMSSPSTSFVTLTLGVSGAYYTAPGDGWIILNKSLGTNEYVLLECRVPKAFQSPGGSAISISTEVEKGEVFRISYTGTGSVNLFRFVYKEGSKP